MYNKLRTKQLMKVVNVKSSRWRGRTGRAWEWLKDSMGEEVRRESWEMGEGKERGRSGVQSYYRSEVALHAQSRLTQ